MSGAKLGALWPWTLLGGDTVPLACELEDLASLHVTLRYSEASTLAVAQIDSTECSDGPPWKRQ